MPGINRSRKIKRQVTTITENGEITINLNLNIVIDDDNTISIEGTQPIQSQGVETPDEIKKVDPDPRLDAIVPTEMFAQNDELLEGFGD